ncbi:MAG: hypothetical protein N0C91_19540 [Candidatus Thiodiazotropha endolucinida]|nr:hypothetical protein [Candidatus Thiodiazotropha taylori]MCW4250842.1 hypothetical protein [Candidatus Thiodiazotropha endolucinida]MCG8040105.1 hypothetical protein [Candidatus Thiodiazotropha taylori]MCG8104560.1 hypothetical protein [Candidatus Thiodiazotropha taylori]MCG8121836.1 hypothetical protein [Candidatus Thiodiazotropha taylori]
MSNILLYISLGLITSALLFILALRILDSRNQLGIEGKLIWIDKGKATKPFFNPSYEVTGKPDLMYRIRDGVLAVEYKSRHGPIYRSDIVQAKCAALAARSDGYPVIQILIKTSTTEEYFRLPRNEADLYGEIKTYVLIAREAKSGAKMGAWPTINKCNGCAFNETCDMKV